MKHKSLLWMLVLINIIFLLMACTTRPDTVTTSEPDSLDAVIRTTSDYLNERLNKGIKLVFLNFQSDYPALSEYVIDGLIANTVNDGLFTAVDRQNLSLIQQEMNFQLSGEVSDESAQTIGKLLGTQTIISGAISPLGNYYLLRVRAIAVETAEIQGQFNRDFSISQRLIALTGNRVISTPAKQTPASGDTRTSQAASTEPNRSASTIQYEKFTPLRTLEVGSRMNVGGPIVFTSDSKGVIGYDKPGLTGDLKLWDSETGKVIKTIRESSNFNSISISPDGNRLITGHGRVIRFWDINSGAYREYNGFPGSIRALDYSPDGIHFAFCTSSLLGSPSDNAIKIWNSEIGQEALNLAGHTSDVLSISYSPDGKQIVSCSRDKTIKLWDAVSGKVIRSISADCSIVSFCPDGRKLAAVEGSKIHIFDAQNGREIFTLTGHSQIIRAIAFSPDGNFLLSTAQGNDRYLIVWNVSNGWEVGRLDTGTANQTSALTFSPDGKYFAVVKNETSITIWGME